MTNVAEPWPTLAERPETMPIAAPNNTSLK